MSFQQAADLIETAKRRGGPVLVMTGAGISAESGIPTFRGTEGYWQIGSVNYRPTELATSAAFRRMPEEVWAWYLYRRSVCRSARPNVAHEALARLERALGEEFLLITQNVDGLHLRAGSSRERTYEIHGNIDWSRCSRNCPQVFPVPPQISTAWPKQRRLTSDEERALRCQGCGEWLRPHVLWFDEIYDEPHYRFESSLRAAEECSLLCIIGTSGSANLPLHVASIAARRQACFLVINTEANSLTELARSLPLGVYLEGTACGDTEHSVPQIAEHIRAVFGQT